jgi:glycine/D-amino acid oxidase-like deaminating enzyme
MDNQSVDIVVCGAGIAGVAAAYFLSLDGNKKILLVDDGPPLGLTSDKSTEAYRNWWPGPDRAMVALMNRSIDLMENLAQEYGNQILLNRRGYLFATADPEKISEFMSSAEMASEYGAGSLRTHHGETRDLAYDPRSGEGFPNHLDGADLVLDREKIRQQFPYLSLDTVAVLHVRRAGWFSGQQLGMLLFQKARDQGVRFVNARVVDVLTNGNAVEKVTLLEGQSERSVETRVFLNAAGPRISEVNEFLGIDLPISWERHLKVSIDDSHNVIPRTAPMLIWDDAQYLLWSEEERALLTETKDTHALLEMLPQGAHLRPEGGPEGRKILMLWPYDLESVAPIFPITIPEMYPEVVLRGLSTMVPGLRTYFNRMPKPFVDGGYYTKTPDNRFLCGPLPFDGAYVLGALSGYGLMAACGAGELIALQINRSTLPAYASAFELSRFDDPAYMKKVARWGSYGQL